MKPKTLPPEMKKLIQETFIKEQELCPARSGYTNMQEQIKDIHEVLIGSSNRYHKGTEEEIGLVRRLKPMIKHYENWESKGNWKLLSNIMFDRKVSSRAGVFFGIGSFAGITGLILSVGAVLRLFGII